MAHGGKPQRWQRVPSLLGLNKTRVLRYQTVKLLQINAQTLTDDKIELLLSHMDSEHFDIALLQEIKQLTKIVEIHGYRIFFYGGAILNSKKESRAGVAIVLGPHAIIAWKEAGMPESQSRLMYVDNPTVGLYVILKFDISNHVFYADTLFRNVCAIVNARECSEMLGNARKCSEKRGNARKCSNAR
jgi:hypothetical protein